MKRIVLTTLLISFLISACGGKFDADIQATVQTSVAQTQQAEKTPLADINLEPALFQQGDLPNQYESGQIAYKWADELPQPVKPDNIVIQKVGRNLSEGFGQEYLLIALFESATDLDTTYNASLDQHKERKFKTAEIGDKAQFAVLDFVIGRTFLVFTRCNALVVVDVNIGKLGEPLPTDEVVSFGQ
jgi:hypothetical protein